MNLSKKWLKCSNYKKVHYFFLEFIIHGQPELFVSAELLKENELKKLKLELQYDFLSHFCHSALESFCCCHVISQHITKAGRTPYYK